MEQAHGAAQNADGDLQNHCREQALEGVRARKSWPQFFHDLTQWTPRGPRDKAFCISFLTGKNVTK